jgi:hypothetical protein
MIGRWLERNGVPVCQQGPPTVRKRSTPLLPVEQHVAESITRPLEFRN